MAHLSGIDLESVVDQKMIINRRRIWSEPDQDGVVEHVREAAEKANSLLEKFNAATDHQFETWQDTANFGRGDREYLGTHKIEEKEIDLYIETP